MNREDPKGESKQTRAAEGRVYHSPKLTSYGDLCRLTNTSLPFTFQENFVLDFITG